MEQPTIYKTYSSRKHPLLNILFSGTLPTKILRVLVNFGRASITAHIFFNHQKLYLQASFVCLEQQPGSGGGGGGGEGLL